MKLLSIILSVIITASIDSTSIWIGNQTAMHLEVQTNANEQVQFPELGHEITQGVEILQRLPIDTIQDATGRKLKQDFVLTCFKDSLYYIDSIAVVVDQDTMYANGVALNVIQPFVIDTTNAAIFDVKDIIQPPIWWWGIIRWILLGLLIAGLCVGIYFAIRYFTRPKEQATEEPKEPLRPADEVALEQLNAIKEEKIWQRGLTKDYYSSITDVLREYISRVFEIDSVEMTTYEILGNLKKTLKNEPATWQQLKGIFNLSDLVKFAKWSPTPDENEKIVRESIDFVNTTYRFISPTNTENSAQPTQTSQQ